MQAVEILLPVVLLIVLGWMLARFQFLGSEFIRELNKLTFYVALPAFIFRSMTEVRVPTAEAMPLFGILLACTVITMLAAPLIANFLGARSSSLGSVAQAAYRGNLAFAGLPILAYSVSGLSPESAAETLGVGLLVFAPLTASYNFFAVLCLQGWGSLGRPGQVWALVRSILTNPLLISCLGGFCLALVGFEFPRPVHTALTALGAVAMPVALLCIGGSFLKIEFHGRYRSIWVAVLCKILLCPLLAALACWWFGITGLEKRIVLIFAAVPTAVTAFTMAKQMGGDEDVTSAAVALSTIFAFGTLTVVLWMTM
jgi:malate permease and related proteins